MKRVDVVYSLIYDQILEKLGLSPSLLWRKL